MVTTPREIIAKQISGAPFPSTRTYHRVDDAIAELNAAGYHILSDADLAARDDAVLALERSVIALDDWIRSYAPDECGPEYVSETRQRIYDNGGTLAYLADIQSRNRAAIRALKGGKP